MGTGRGTVETWGHKECWAEDGGYIAREPPWSQQFHTNRPNPKHRTMTGVDHSLRPGETVKNLLTERTTVLTSTRRWCILSLLVRRASSTIHPAVSYHPDRVRQVVTVIPLFLRVFTVFARWWLPLVYHFLAIFPVKSARYSSFVTP